MTRDAAALRFASRAESNSEGVVRNALPASEAFLSR